MANDYGVATMKVRTTEDLTLNDKKWGDNNEVDDLLIDSASQYITRLSTSAAMLVDIEWGTGDGFPMGAEDFKGQDLARVRIRNESTTDTARLAIGAENGVELILPLLPGGQFEWRRPFYLIDPAAGNWWQTATVSKINTIQGAIDPAGALDFNVEVFVASYAQDTYPVPT